MRPEPLIMYTIVRTDLPKNQQTVQTGHAIAELAFNAGKHGNLAFERWVKDDRTLIVLRARDEDDLKAQRDRINAAGLEHFVFHEPDRGNEATALAIHPGTASELDGYFGSMQLA